MKKNILNWLMGGLLGFLMSGAYAMPCGDYLDQLSKQHDEHMKNFMSSAHTDEVLPSLTEIENNLGKVEPQKIAMQTLKWDNYFAVVLGNEVIESGGEPPEALRQKFGSPTIGEINAVMGSPKSTSNETVLKYMWSCPEKNSSNLSIYVQDNNVTQMSVVASKADNGVSVWTSGMIKTPDLTTMPAKIQQQAGTGMQQMVSVVKQYIQLPLDYQQALKNCTAGKYAMADVANISAGTPVVYRTIQGLEGDSCVVAQSVEYPKGSGEGNSGSGVIMTCKYSPATIQLLIDASDKMEKTGDFSSNSNDPLSQALAKECSANVPIVGAR